MYVLILWYVFQSSFFPCPAQLMFGRQIRNKLPQLLGEAKQTDEEIRDRDWQRKMKGKIEADAKRGAVKCNILPGDKVLLKNDKQGKLEPRFRISPYTVKTRCGQELTLESSDGVRCQRNSSFVKPLVQLEEDVENDSVTNNDSVKEGAPNNNMPATEQPPVQQSPPMPKRHPRRPIKYKDYVCGSVWYRRGHKYK